MGEYVPEGEEFFFAHQVTLEMYELEEEFPEDGDPPECLLFDVSDYLDSCIGRSGITGIQRVQEALTRVLLTYLERLFFVIVDRTYGRLWALDPEALNRLIGDGDSRPGLSDLEERGRFSEGLRDNARLRIPRRCDSMVNIGSFWSEQYDERLEEYIKRIGCRYILMIYDLIPVDHPEFCESQTAASFVRSLPRALSRAHGVIAISQFTKARLQSFGLARGLTLPRIDVVPLAHQLTERPLLRQAVERPPTLPDIDGEFVLCVGTIEPRKNHLRLVETWARLAMKAATMPTLVIVGKIGWIDPAALARMTDIAQTTGKVAFAHHVSDEQLMQYYRHCMFTVFLSIEEGWGLPVGESLAFGKICLTGGGGALPEVGGKFAIYVDATDEAEIYSALYSLITDHHGRCLMEENILKTFRPRTWRQVAAELVMNVQKHG